MIRAGSNNGHRARRVGAAVVAGLLILSGCGDDDPEGTAAAESARSSSVAATTVAATTPATTAPAPTTPPTTPATTRTASTTPPSTALPTTESNDGESAEPAVCGPYLEVSAAFAGQPDPATIGGLLDQVDAEAPAEIADRLGVLTSGARTVLETGDFGVFEDPAFGAAIADADAWVVENCQFATQAELVAVEYAYEGQAAEYAAGRAVFTLVNQGAEAHELLLLRKNDGVELTIDELLALPESEAETLTAYVGGVFVGPPGSTGNLVADLTAGSYIAVCTIPAGTVVSEDGSATEGTGEPHVMLGMSFEFTVA